MILDFIDKIFDLFVYLFSLYFFVNILLYIIKQILTKFNNVNFKLFGKWAIVTGCTEGIGREYANILAKNGLNIILISRSFTKLEKLSNEIKKQYSVETKIIVVDFTEDPEKYTRKIIEGVNYLDIGVLVNNVGIVNFPPNFFLKVKNNNEIIYCNIFSLISMCKIVLPIMCNKKTGLIINISSTSALFPTPMITTYGATKAFIDKFSEDLYTEYKSKGIIIQCVLPGYVSTKATRIKNPNIFCPESNVFVSSAIKTVGIFSRTEGYLPHVIFPGIFYIFGNALKPITRNIMLFLMMKNNNNI